MPRSESTKFGVLDRMIERFGTALTKPGDALRRKAAKIRDMTAAQNVTFQKEQEEQDQRLIDGYVKDRTSRLRRRGLLPARPKTA